MCRYESFIKQQQITERMKSFYRTHEIKLKKIKIIKNKIETIMIQKYI